MSNKAQSIQKPITIYRCADAEIIFFPHPEKTGEKLAYRRFPSMVNKSEVEWQSLAALFPTDKICRGAAGIEPNVKYILESQLSSQPPIPITPWRVNEEIGNSEALFFNSDPNFGWTPERREQWLKKHRYRENPNGTFTINPRIKAPRPKATKPASSFSPPNRRAMGR